MINLLLGAPGGGKSYEAVVFHVLPALQNGRKVITNLALNLDAFALLDPSYPGLIEIRRRTLATRPARGNIKTDPHARFVARLGLDKERTWNGAAFAQVEDFGDPWRHPVNGTGPLYVVDECHISLPKVGTPVPVEEWFSLHRHEFADVLLISQSYGKVNAAIRDLVQIVYRVRKNVALGSSGSYTRKVQDGIRGEVVNTSIRRYDKRYFGLYQSHTKSGAGLEMGAQDIVPLWRHWSVWACGLSLVVLGGFVWWRGNPFAFFTHKPAPVQAVPVASVPAKGEIKAALEAARDAAAPEAVKTASAGSAWPYGALQLHVGGVLHSASKSILLIVFSQNGQRVFTQTGRELEAAGYTLTLLNDCLVRVEWGKLAQYIACDAPRIGVDNAYAKPVAAERAPAGEAARPVAPSTGKQG